MRIAAADRARAAVGIGGHGQIIAKGKAAAIEGQSVDVSASGVAANSGIGIPSVGVRSYRGCAADGQSSTDPGGVNIGVQATERVAAIAVAAIAAGRVI